MSALLGRIIVIKRNGSDGAHFPLRAEECLFGRNNECDIRIQLPTVSKEHARISVDLDKKVWLENLSTCQDTLLNGCAISGLTPVSHLDVFTISDRSFRFEFPSPKKITPKKSPVSMKRRSGEGISIGERKSLTPRSSPRSHPLPLDTLKENIDLLRRQSVPLKEVDESILSPLTTKNPLSTVCEINVLNNEVVVTPTGKQKSPGRRRSNSNTTKRVSFGSILSPELFDKTLPAATPVKRGATPRRLSSESKPILNDVKRRRSVVVSPSTDAIFEEDEIVENELTDNNVKEDDNSSNDIEECPCEQSESEIKEETAMVVDLVPCTVSDPVLPAEDEESPKAVPSLTPRRSSRRLSSLMMQQIETLLAEECKSSVQTPSQAVENKEKKKRLSTPVRKAIESGFQLKVTKKKLATPLRKAIQSRPTLTETKKKMATPLRHEIIKGIELKATKKKLSTPLRQEIHSKPALRETKKKLATLLRKEIQSKPALRETKKKLATPLRKEIQSKPALRETKKKLATPLRKEIQSKPALRETKKKLATPLRHEIQSKPKLRQTKKRMCSDLQDEIKQGLKLRATKKIMAYDLQIDIIKGKKLRATKKKMATPLKEEIQKGVSLRKTMKSLPTPLKTENAAGFGLKKTKKKLPVAMQDEIKQGKTLRQTKKKMQTPLRKEIALGIDLRLTKKKMATPLKNDIQKGTELRKIMKKMATPLRKEIESHPKRRKSSQGGNMSKKLKCQKTPLADPKKTILSQENELGFRLRQRRLATPLRRDIHRCHTLKPLRRKSTRLSSAKEQPKKKPTYAEILKRPKKVAVRRLSSKRVIGTKFGPVALPGQIAKVSSTEKMKKLCVEVDTQSELDTKSIEGVAELFITPVTSHTRVTRSTRKSGNWSNKNIKTLSETTRGEPEVDLDGVPEMFATPKEAQKKTRSTKRSSTGNWLDVIAKTLPDTRSREVVEEDLDGLKELFATPEETAKKIKTTRKKYGNWLDVIAKTLDQGKSKRLSADFEGLKELFSTPSEMFKVVEESSKPSLHEKDSQVSIHVEPAKVTRTPSLRQVAIMRNSCQAEGTPKTIKAITTPSLRLSRRSDETCNLALMTSPLLQTQTPSLRTKDSQFLTVYPLDASKTPSLRYAEETFNMFKAIEPSKTPSLRNAEEAMQVFEAVQASKTPSLRSGDNKTVRIKKNKERQSVDYTGIKQLMKTPKTKNDVNDPENNYESSWFTTPGPSTKAPKNRKAVAHIAEDFTLEIMNNELKEEKSNKPPRIRNAINDIEENFVPGLFASPVHKECSAKIRRSVSKKATPKATEVKNTVDEEVVIEDNDIKLAEPLAVVVEADFVKRTTRSKRTALEQIEEPAEKRTKQDKSDSKPAPVESKRNGRKTRSSTKNTKSASSGIVETPKPIAFKHTALDPIPELPTPLTSPRATRTRTVSLLSPTLEAIQEKQQDEVSKEPAIRSSRRKMGVKVIELPLHVSEAKPSSRSTRKTRRENKEEHTTVAANQVPMCSSRKSKDKVPGKEEMLTSSEEQGETQSTRSQKLIKEPAPEKVESTSRRTRRTNDKVTEQEIEMPTEEPSEKRSTRIKRQVKETGAEKVSSRRPRTRKTKEELPAEKEMQKCSTETNETRSTRRKNQLKESAPEKVESGRRKARRTKDKECVVEQKQISDEEPNVGRSMRASKSKQSTDKAVNDKSGMQDSVTKPSKRTRSNKNAVKEETAEITPEKATRSERNNRGKKVVEKETEVEIMAPKRSTRGRKTKCEATANEEMPNNSASIPADEKQSKSDSLSDKAVQETEPQVKVKSRLSRTKKEPEIQEQEVPQRKTRGKRLAEEQPLERSGNRKKRVKTELEFEEKMEEEKPRSRRTRAAIAAKEETTHKLGSRGRKRQATKAASPSPKKQRMTTRSRK